MATKNPKTPLGAWPAGAQPRTVADLERNIKEARKRLDQCLAEKSIHWRYVHENSATGFLQSILYHREECEKWGNFAIKVEKLIGQWEVRRAELLVKPEPVLDSVKRDLARTYLGTEPRFHQQQRQE